MHLRVKVKSNVKAVQTAGIRWYNAIIETQKTCGSASAHTYLKVCEGVRETVIEDHYLPGLSNHFDVSRAAECATQAKRGFGGACEAAGIDATTSLLSLDRGAGGAA